MCSFVIIVDFVSACMFIRIVLAQLYNIDYVGILFILALFHVLSTLLPFSLDNSVGVFCFD